MHPTTGVQSALYKAPLHLRLLLGFGLVLALCAAQSIFAFRTAADNVAADEKQYRRQEIAALANQTRTALLQMEAGYRGYMLSGDEGLLASYRDAVAAFNADLAQVLAADDQANLGRWQTLERRVSVWQADIIEPGIARREAATAGGPEASGLVSFGLSQQDIDGIQRLLDVSIGVEQRAMSESQAASIQANNRLMAVQLWGTLAVLGVGLAVAALSARYLARAIAEVKAGERRYHQMFANNPAIKVLVDASSGAVVEVNQAACDFYGYPRADLLRLNLSDLSMRSTADVAEDVTKIETGVLGSFVSRHRLASGEVREIEVQSSRVDDMTGRVLLYCIIHDVTERTLAETRLATAEERTRLALQAARVGTWDLDFTRDKHTWSVENEAIFGLAPGTYGATQAAFKLLVHPDDWAAHQIEMEATKAEHRDSTSVYRTVWPDGSTHWVEEKCRPSYAADGTLLRMMGTCVDITERKRVEEALRASEERFRKQYKGFPLPAYSWLQAGADFVLQDFNDAAEAMADGQLRDALGSSASGWYSQQPEILADLQTCVAEQRPLKRESRLRSGSVEPERDMALSYVFVPPSTVMLHTEDITAAKHADRQREAMAQSEKLRALGQMAMGIAHDLNQSLMLVASYSDLARQALVQDPTNIEEVQDLLTTTTQAALDGGETVKRLLLFTRAAPEHDNKRVDLTSVVRDAAQLTAPRWRDAAQAEGRPISLHIEADGYPTVHGSPGRLRELMTNLIFNSVDALPTGGKIRLRVTARDRQGIVEVVDSGTGMTAEVQARVFEPFYTTKGEGGTGLGLAMVFGIVEQHAGRIEVRSAPGVGTTFRLSFPLIDALAKGEPPAPSAIQQAPPRPLRVLAVDDEPMMTKAVVRMLKPSGHLVSVAGSGEEALEKLVEQTFDVVVSDMGMGAGMNGWDLAEAVRTRWPDVRFLLATGWGAAMDSAEARTRGVEAVLGKPYHPVELLHALAGTDIAA
ncbi:MAG: ATP-binding protein [Chloroflexota bacterium]